MLRKENGGKWSALNLAFRESQGEIVVCVDADSQLEPDCLGHLVGRFGDPEVGCCCGQVSVRNRGALLTRLQALEYVLMNGLLRRVQSYFGTVLVAPGPLSAFRRSTLEEIARRSSGGGPWEGDTFAEDADVTLMALILGKKVVYEHRAVSRTAAPTWAYALVNQRYRWTRGNLQAALKAWRRWREARDAPRRLPVWLGALLFETIAWPLVNLYGMLAFAVFVALFGLEGHIAVWFLALTALDANAAAFSLRLEGESAWLALLAPLNRVYFNIVLDVSKLFALYDEWRGAGMKWS